MAYDNGTPVNQQDPKEVLDGLSQLWANLPRAAAPVTPGAVGAPPGAPPVAASPQLGMQMPRATAPPPPQPAAPAAPATDDPQLAGARQRFQDTTSQYSDLLQQQKDIGNKISSVPQVNRADYKPSLGRNILAMVLGTMAGMKGNTQLAADTANSVRDSKYNRAEETRNKELAPFLAQQNAIERQVPLLHDTSDAAWRQYQAGMEGAKLNLAEKKEADTTQLRSELNDIRDRAAQGNIEERDARRLDQIEQEKDKVKNDRDRLALEQQIATIRQQTANTGTANETDRATQAEINQKSRPINSRLAAMEHTRALLLAEGGADEQIKKLDGEIKASNDELDKIETDVRARRQPAGGAAGSPAGAAAPAGAPPATLWKNKESKVLTLKDSKGNTSKWQLKNGQPTQLQGGSK
jgi:hypothetical protein